MLPHVSALTVGKYEGGRYKERGAWETWERRDCRNRTSNIKVRNRDVTTKKVLFNVACDC
jgi:hypothetical protein